MTRLIVHRITDVDPMQRLATCAGCGPETRVVFKANKGFWVCRTSDSRRSPEARARRRRVASRRAGDLRRKFGLTEADYDALLAAQNGVCAICEQTCSTGRRLAVDHDHDTGAVRGLLCSTCNRGLGLMGDRPGRLLRAIEYMNASRRAVLSTLPAAP